MCWVARQCRGCQDEVASLVVVGSLGSGRMEVGVGGGRRKGCCVVVTVGDSPDLAHDLERVLLRSELYMSSRSDVLAVEGSAAILPSDLNLTQELSNWRCCTQYNAVSEARPSPLQRLYAYLDESSSDSYT